MKAKFVPLLAAMCGALAAALAGAPAAAQAAIVAPEQCYARSYAAEHLKQRPRQNVRSILLRRLTRAQSGIIPADKIAILVGIRIRGQRDLLQNYAECRQRGAALVCDMEGDAGGIRIEQASTNRIRIAVTRTLGFEADRYIEVGGKVSDDNVFLLGRSPDTACSALKLPAG